MDIHKVAWCTTGGRRQEAHTCFELLCTYFAYLFKGLMDRILAIWFFSATLLQGF